MFKMQGSAAAWPSSMHRPSYNIPLIISGCGVNYDETPALVSQLDLPNTILSFAGLPLLEGHLTDSRPLDLKDPSPQSARSLGNTFTLFLLCPFREVFVELQKGCE